MDLYEDGGAEAYAQRELDELCQIADAGMDLAIAAALHYCAKYQVPAPQWLVERASSLLNALLDVEDDGARQRIRKQMSEYQRNQIHYARYDAVKSAKDAREKLRNESAHLSSATGQKARLVKADIKSVADRIGPSDETIFEEVSRHLSETFAKGGADAIKKSYQDLLKLERDEKLSFQYYIFDPEFLRRIGVRQKIFKEVKGRQK